MTVLDNGVKRKERGWYKVVRRKVSTSCGVRRGGGRGSESVDFLFFFLLSLFFGVLLFLFSVRRRSSVQRREVGGLCVDNTEGRQGGPCLLGH